MTTYAAIFAAALVLIALGGLLIWRAGRAERRAGAAETERDTYRTKAEQARRANAIDEDVHRLSDDALDRELRDGR